MCCYHQPALEFSPFDEGPLNFRWRFQLLIEKWERSCNFKLQREPLQIAPPMPYCNIRSHDIRCKHGVTSLLEAWIMNFLVGTVHSCHCLCWFAYSAVFFLPLKKPESGAQFSAAYAFVPYKPGSFSRNLIWRMWTTGRHLDLASLPYMSNWVAGHLQSHNSLHSFLPSVRMAMTSVVSPVAVRWQSSSSHRLPPAKASMAPVGDAVNFLKVTCFGSLACLAGTRSSRSKLKALPATQVASRSVEDSASSEETGCGFQFVPFVSFQCSISSIRFWGTSQVTNVGELIPKERHDQSWQSFSKLGAKCAAAGDHDAALEAFEAARRSLEQQDWRMVLINYHIKSDILLVGYC